MGDHLIETWKKCRESIEHFDKLLADFRRMMLTIEGVALSAAITILLSNSASKVLFIGYLCLGVSIMNIIVWAVEKHYHLYLLVSASVAKKIEEQLGLAEDIRLTAQLRNARQKQPALGSISLYDLMYLVPALFTLYFALWVGLLFWVAAFFITETILVIWVLVKQHAGGELES